MIFEAKYRLETDILYVTEKVLSRADITNNGSFTRHIGSVRWCRVPNCRIHCLVI